MKKQLQEQDLEDLLGDLKNRVIIVEGKKDEKALKSLGMKHIIAVNGRPLYKVVEIALNTKREIVILTDFDKNGRQTEKKLRYLLQRQGKNPNSRLRCKVMALGKNKIEDFGGIVTPKIISLKEDDYHVKTRTHFNKICYKSRNRRTRSHRKT